MATRLPLYLMRDGQTRLGQTYFNPVWADLDSRLDTLERIKIDWNAQVAQLRELGLKRIDDYIRPLTDEVDALLANASAETEGLAAALFEEHVTPIIQQLEQTLQHARDDTDRLAQALVNEHIAPILQHAQQLRSDIQTIKHTASQDAAAIAQALAEMNWEQQLSEVIDNVNQALTDLNLEQQLNALEHAINQALAKKLDATATATNAQQLDGETPDYYRNASNLNSGTLPSERLPPATANQSGAIKVRLNGTTAFITNNGNPA